MEFVNERRGTEWKIGNQDNETVAEKYLKVNKTKKNENKKGETKPETVRRKQREKLNNISYTLMFTEIFTLPK